MNEITIDEKLRILSAVKKSWGERVTTVFVRQGKFALDDRARAAFPQADQAIERIADLIEIEPDALTRRPTPSLTGEVQR